MEGNDRAFLVGLIAAIVLVWSWTGSQAEINALRNERQQLADRLQQTQREYDGYQRGVLSR